MGMDNNKEVGTEIFYSNQILELNSDQRIYYNLGQSTISLID